MIFKRQYKSRKYRVIKTMRQLCGDVVDIHVVQLLTLFNTWCEVDWYYSIESCREYIISRERLRFMKVRVANRSEDVVCHLEVTVDADNTLFIIDTPNQ
jgi:hypothetical protein